MSQSSTGGERLVYKPADPDFKKRCLDSFATQKFMEDIGARITVLEPGFCEIELPYKDELTQQDGYFHAGIIGTMADNAGGYAAFTLYDQNSALLSVEYKVNMLSPGDGEMLIARGYVVKHGRTLTICKADIFSKKGDKESLCGTAQMTMFQKR